MEGRALLTTAAFLVTTDWGSGFGGQVTIANTQASPVNNWSLAFDFDRSITSIWDGVISSHVGNHYVVTNAGWNATIAANGGQAEFGFNGAPGNVGSDQPVNYTLDGVPIGANTGPVPPVLSVNSVTVNDGTSGTTALFTVSLSRATSQAVSVPYATSDGSARAGVDYTATSGTLTIAAGKTSATVAVPILADTVAKPVKTFALYLSNPSSATLGAGTGTGTIVDTVQTVAPPVANPDSATTTEGVAVTVSVLANDTDSAGRPLSIAAVGQGQDGSVVANLDGSITYTPIAGYTGTDSFPYSITDGQGLTASTTVTINVNPAIANTGVWPSHVYAPYVDVTLYPTFNLLTAVQSHGLKYFTMAFVVADPSNNAPSWGGYASYDVNGGDFDRALRAQVASIRQLGGDVMVSFGGEAGQELAQAITSVPALTAAYEQVINAYSLTHVDFDIEGAAEADHASIDRRSQALAAVQRDASAAGRALDVAFTLPVLPTGLTGDGLYVLQSAQKYGVQVSGVNIMTMDFGDYAAPNPAGQMGTYVIDSGQSLFTQLQSLYGPSQTDVQLWSMIGLTPMIGVNDTSNEIFGFPDANQVLAWAKQKGIGRISIWSLTRDQPSQDGATKWAEATSSSIAQAPYQFSDIFKTFTA